MTDIIQWKPGMEPEAGKCYAGIPNQIYHRAYTDWRGSTTIKHAIRSVESFLYEIEQPPKHSLPFERGHALHSGVEGLTIDGTLSLFESEVIECPTATINSKAWQELKEANPEKAILPASEIKKTRKMALRLYEKGKEACYFDQGWPELSFFWIDEETGLQLKCRLDWLRMDGWALDYKTSKAHYLEAFNREIASYNYHLSAAMYLAGVYAVTGVEIPNWHFLVVANTPPREVEAYELDEPSLAEGRALFRETLNKIKNYVPAKKLKPKKISLPRYAFRLTG